MWEKIGQYHIGGTVGDTHKIPRWVDKAIDKLESPAVATGTTVNYYLKGRHYEYKISDNNYDCIIVYRRNLAVRQQKIKNKKRYRATALIFKNGRLLLVRDRGKKHYSMPGGGFKKNESTITAAIREIAEELGLKVTAAERLKQCDFEGQRAKHKVCLLETEGSIHIDRKELSEYLWWDMKETIPVQGHVKKILHEYHRLIRQCRS